MLRTPILLAGFLGASIVWAQAPSNVNIRGIIQSFSDNRLIVTTGDARTVTVEMPEQVNVATTKLFGMADIKPGMKLGVTTVVRTDGQIVAIDVRPLSATANVGLSPYDLQPGSTMTNGILEAVVDASGGREILLNYQTGQVKVIVPPEATMSQAAPGSRSDLQAGETVYIAARRSEDSKLTAVRVQVSKDGVKPTQ